MVSIYTAGPLGFSEPGRRYHREVLLPALADAGFEALDPWALPLELEAVLALPVGDAERLVRLPGVNAEIARRNAAMITASDAMLAVLDGTDVDSGTAAEIGYAAALAKPIVGLRTDFRISGDNEAATVNLQVEWFITESGGSIVSDLGTAVARCRACIR
ncbi:MAG TPA: nucleoside 2-deoxyribosyltransferase [Acidimicrobiia bacterium]